MLKNKTSKMEKGILLKTVEAKLATILDDVVKLNGFWETIDGVAFRLVISAVDDNLADKIPEPYKTEIRTVIFEIIENEDYDQAVLNAFDFLDSLIDIPGFDDDTERLMFEAIAKMVVAAILAIKKK